MVLMAETYPPRQAVYKKDVPKADKATQVRVGSAGPHTHSRKFFWKHACTPKLCAHHPCMQPSSPGMQLGHARGCMSVYSPGKHRQGFGRCEQTGVAQPGVDSCTGAGDPPEMEDWTLLEPPHGSLPFPSLGSAHAWTVFDGVGVPGPRAPLPSRCYRRNGCHRVRRRRKISTRAMTRTSRSSEPQGPAVPQRAAPKHRSAEPPAPPRQLSQPRTGNAGTVWG